MSYLLSLFLRVEPNFSDCPGFTAYKFFQLREYCASRYWTCILNRLLAALELLVLLLKWIPDCLSSGSPVD